MLAPYSAMPKIHVNLYNCKGAKYGQGQSDKIHSQKIGN